MHIDARIAVAEKALGQGGLEDAESAAREVLAAAPHDVRAHSLLGRTHLRRGAFAEAAESLRRSVAAAPTGEDLIALGASCMQLGLHEEALQSFEHLARLVPEASVAHYNVGVARETLGDPRGAERAYREEIARAGANAQSPLNLSLLLRRDGRPQAAREVLETAVAARPQDPNLLLGLAQFEVEHGSLDTAQTLFSGLTRFAFPSDADGWLSFVRHLDGLGGTARADELLAALQPRFSTHVGLADRLATRLRATKAHARAVSVLKDRVALEPAPMAYYELHEAALDAFDHDVAAWAISEGRARFPEEPLLTLTEALWLPHAFTGAEEALEARARYARGLSTLERAVDPRDSRWLQLLDRRTSFWLAYQGEGDRDLAERYGRLHTALAERHDRRSTPPAERVDRRPTPPAASPRLEPAPARARTRVGFLSAFFRGHTVSKLMGRFLTELDRDRIEVFGYHVGAESDATTEALAAGTEHFLHLPGDLAAISAQLRADELDVLVLMDVGMSVMSHALAARRHAPIQATTLCHPDTTGYPHVDYFLSSEAAEPEGAETHYTETLVRLPGLGVLFPARPPASPVRRSFFGLPEEGLLLISPQSVYKYHPSFDRAYAQILERVPGAQLALLEGNAPDLAGALRRRIEAEGSSLEGRIHLLSAMSEENFGRLHQLADLNLDSLPWSSCTSILEGWCHAPLPLVAWRGPFMRHRTGAAVLDRVGLPELAADTPEAFVDIAVRIAVDDAERARARARIRDHRDRAFGGPEILRALEDSFEAWAQRA